MRRAVSLLLCVALVSAQWLSGGRCHVAPSECSPDHDARPHVHVGHASGHHHEHPPAEPMGLAWCDASAEHDADTVAIPDLTASAPKPPAAPQMTTCGVDLPALVLASVAVTEACGTLGAHPPPPIVPDCPLFLRTLSIRC